MVTDEYSRWVSKQTQEVGFNDLTPSEVLEALRAEHLKFLLEARDTAKLLYEEEGDDTSFGEYLGMVRAIEMFEKLFNEAPSKLYRKSRVNSLKGLAQGYVSNETMKLMQGYAAPTFQPPGHTG
jgi:hypothetical protein